MPKSPSEIWTHFEVVPKSEQAKNAHLQTDQYRCRYCREVRAKNASRFINHIARDCTEVPPAVAQEVRTRLYKQHRTTAPREAYGGRLTRTDPELRVLTGRYGYSDYGAQFSEQVPVAFSRTGYDDTQAPPVHPPYVSHSTSQGGDRVQEISDKDIHPDRRWIPDPLLPLQRVVLPSIDTLVNLTEDNCGIESVKRTSYSPQHYPRWTSDSPPQRSFAITNHLSSPPSLPLPTLAAVTRGSGIAEGQQPHPIDLATHISSHYPSRSAENYIRRDHITCHLHRPSQTAPSSPSSFNATSHGETSYLSYTPNVRLPPPVDDYPLYHHTVGSTSLGAPLKNQLVRALASSGLSPEVLNRSEWQPILATIGRSDAERDN